MILASPNAPEGSVKTLVSYEPSDFLATSAILCRNTAPLVSFAFSLIQRHIGCRVLGREIGQGLVSLIQKLNPTSLDELRLKLEMYEQRETEKFTRKGELQSAEAIRDRCACIQIFLSHADSLESLTSRISSLFDDKTSGLLTLATIHKAKGLEWPTVFILDFKKFQPSPFAHLPWQKIQERNLIYVAITRAQIDLRYIESGKWKEAALPQREVKYSDMELLAMED